ncbi:MAG: MBL fold metallo-hydrolase [Ardenticatenaceae bacterium]|nr:MBL fold metallo-hydrolase [Ardenticatenaceae bacterium]
MRITTLDGRSVHFIQRGWYNSNSVLITGPDGAAIVDTGHRGGANDLLALIQEEGVDPTSVRLIVNTHSHWDHHGGNRALQGVSGAPIAMSATTAAWLGSDERWLTWLDYFGEKANGTQADVVWQDGDEVDLVGLRFQVFAAPGHAPDAITLYQPDGRLLISADALHENDCGVINVAVHGDGALDAATATIERFRGLPVDVALPGHGRLIEDVPASLDAVAQRLAGFRADPSLLAWHLSRRVFMVYLMVRQPIERYDLIEAALQAPWVDDYAPRCGFHDPVAFADQLIDEFMQRGLVMEEDGRLISRIAK